MIADAMVDTNVLIYAASRLAEDQDKARVLANQVDTMIWQEGFNLPLFQSPGNRAVRRDLANYGAAGLADVDYTTTPIGVMVPLGETNVTLLPSVTPIASASRLPIAIPPELSKSWSVPRRTLL